MIFKKIIFIFALAACSIVNAVEPDEVLANPKLEERARQISKDLRCLVCQNESIDESDAALARDLRVLVRERLQAGDSNDEVIKFVVDRYGEFALLRPRIDGVNYLLWWFGPLFLLFSVLTAVFYVRNLGKISKTQNDLTAPLNDEERKKLKEIMGDKKLPLDQWLEKIINDEEYRFSKLKLLRAIAIKPKSTNWEIIKVTTKGKLIV